MADILHLVLNKEQADELSDYIDQLERYIQVSNEAEPDFSQWFNYFRADLYHFLYPESNPPEQ